MSWRGSKRALACAALLVACPIVTHASESGSDAYVADRQLQRSLKQIRPLEPEQIQRAKQRERESRQAIEERPQAELVTSSKILRLQPGAKPAVIRVAPGYVSSVVILDRSGAPWPVTSASLGSSDGFAVSQPDTGKHNILQVSAKKQNQDSNISLTLENHATPVVMRITTDPNEASSLTSFRADQLGPNAHPEPVGPAVEPTASSTIMAFLDGVPPQSAQRVVVHGAKGRDIHVWRYNQSLYVRTRLAAVWPAWSEVSNGVGGLRVYKMRPVSQLMMSMSGEIVTLRLADGPHMDLTAR